MPQSMVTFDNQMGVLEERVCKRTGGDVEIDIGAIDSIFSDPHSVHGNQKFRRFIASDTGAIGASGEDDRRGQIL